MNNLDSRCPNIVSVEIHFNNFMEDIVRIYKDRFEDENEGHIVDYNFKYDHGAKTFHSLLNNIHAKHLNNIIGQTNTKNTLYEDLCESMDSMVDLFEEWANSGLIILDIKRNDDSDEEELEECNKCGYEDVSWCMSNKCQFQEECEKCDTTDSVGEYWWSEQANTRWLLCESCGEKEGQIKCKY